MKIVLTVIGYTGISYMDRTVYEPWRASAYRLQVDKHVTYHTSLEDAMAVAAAVKQGPARIKVGFTGSLLLSQRTKLVHKMMSERAQALYEAYGWSPHRASLLRQAEQLRTSMELVQALHRNSL